MAAVLEAYRSTRVQRYSARLIELLGPWLGAARGRLIAAPPYLDDEDAAQELSLEVLRIATRWRPQCEDTWIARRLVEAAERRVRRRLGKERSRPSEELSEDTASTPEPESVVFDTPIGKASASDLRVIYRVKVLREPMAKLAAESGVTPRRMRQVVRQALMRARMATASESKA